MADIKWIKITTDIFDDEKILLIESLPDADSIIVIWFKLLCLAGKTNNSGVFMINETIPYTPKMLSTIFRRKESTVTLALDTFEQFGMIRVIDDVITIPNWGKHQNLDSLEKKSDYMKNYMRNYRKKQKEIACKTNSKTNGKSNVSRTEKEIEQDIEQDIEQEREKEFQKENNMHIFLDEFEVLWSRYPKKRGKQKAQDAYIRHRKKGVSYETISQGLNNYIEYIKESKTDTQYIKDGSTWFRNQCWDDDYQVKRKLSKIEEWGMA